MKWILSIGSMLISVCASADIAVLSMNEVAVMQLRSDSQYDVICRNGNREVVSDLDIKYNNLCPHATTSTPTEILSLQYRTDGMFDVICRDGSREIVSSADVLSGKVCHKGPKPSFLRNGHYKSASGYRWTDQDITVEGNPATGATKIKVDPPAVNWTAYLECTTGTCRGTAGGHRFVLQILTETSYRFGEETSDGGIENSGVLEK